MTAQSRNNAIDVLLADSLKELAAAKPIEKITIREITDKAGVIRPTFYNHFQDKYELLEWIVQNELIAPIEPYIEKGQLRDGLIVVLSDMLSERDFYIQAVHLEGQNSFMDILKKTVSRLILKYLSLDSMKESTGYAWLTAEKIADLYAESISYAVTTWAREGMKVPVQELVDAFLYLYAHSIVEIWENNLNR